MDSPSLNSTRLKYVHNHQIKNGKTYYGGDKTSIGMGFTKKYEELFCHLRDSKINLLESGVHQGRSLAMWADCFANGNIYGVDICLSQYRKTTEELRRISNER